MDQATGSVPSYFLGLLRFSMTTEVVGYTVYSNHSCSQVILPLNLIRKGMMKS